ncbi:hypothetical protein HMPREF9080_00697 [Cardiobacterium valvarum F0432]|uniref:Uncharacterized protein n=1 Tax=Cardiobacterium valvarum F0432 TaxID=797473 RepID=G9ZD63_9GAMM|nr:hypothetical protein HMPREF9080_00697 [Cardiobacterium valvarum F0432]
MPALCCIKKPPHRGGFFVTDGVYRAAKRRKCWACQAAIGIYPTQTQRPYTQ